MNTSMTSSSKRAGGFTMIELLVGSAVMLVAVLGALFIYSRSNKVSVEQQMVTEVQNDVRSSMFFLSRDLRMAGAGLPEEFASYFIEGRDNEDQGGGEVMPDRVTLMGNIEDPLNLPIRNYQGSAATLDIEDFSFEQYPYPDVYLHQQVSSSSCPTPNRAAGRARSVSSPTSPTTPGGRTRNSISRPASPRGSTRRGACPGPARAPTITTAA